MNTISLLSYVFGLISALLLLLGYFLLIDDIGFPDGHITAYRHAGKVLYEVIIFPGIAMMAYFIYLGRTALTSQNGIKLLITTLTLLVTVFTVVVLDRYFFAQLDHGQGG